MNSIMFIDERFYKVRRDNPDSSINSKEKVYCMCDEYDFIKSFICADPKRKERYLAIHYLCGITIICSRCSGSPTHIRLSFCSVLAAISKARGDNDELEKIFFPSASGRT